MYRKPFIKTSGISILLALIILTVLTTCNNPGKDADESGQRDSGITRKANDPPSGISSTPDTIPIWTYDHELGFPKNNRKVDPDTLNPESLIDLINATKGGDTIRILLRKISNDTIFVEIMNSIILTQQMGSAGADAYLSTTTFTLTELNGIDYVHFEFEIGDHASPGTYSRKYYFDRRERDKINNPT